MGNELGRMVRERMRTLGLTYEQTAERAGISRPYLAKIIQGTRNPSEKNILKLADALNLERKHLLLGAYQSRLPQEMEPLEFFSAPKTCPCRALCCQTFGLVKNALQMPLRIIDRIKKGGL